MELINKLAALEKENKELKRKLEEANFADEHLRVKNAFFEELIEASPEAIVILSNEDRVIRINRRFTQLFEYTQDEAVNQRINDLIVPEQYHYEGFTATADVAKGKFIYLETVRRSKSGNLIDVSIQGNPIVTGGKQLAVYGIYRDITEKKNAEKAIRENEEKLREMNDAKDKFFSIIAHELRSPIGGFKGLSEVLAKEWESIAINDLKKMSLAIYESANSVYRLLNDLLLWSTTQTGTLPYKPELLDFSELVNNCVAFKTKSAKEKSISIQNNCLEGISITCDRNMITTVIHNLIDNAIKFTNQNGEGEIIISCKQDNKFLHFSVSDNGIGMDNNTINSLFKTGESYSKQGTAGEKGTGLGLILCKEFIEKHNGKIWVESILGKGSNFHFKIALKS